MWSEVPPMGQNKWSSPPRPWLLISVDDQFCLYYLWLLKCPCWPRPPLSSPDPLVVLHTKVMMTTSIKKSFKSDFLYLTYPSSEKSCHSNKLASEKQWEKEGMGGEGNPFQKLSLWEEETGAGRGGAQGWLFLKWNAEPFGPLPCFSEAPRTTCQRHKSLGNSFCLYFLCTLFSKASTAKAIWAEIWTFPQNLQPPFTKLTSIRIKVLPPKWCHS